MQEALLRFVTANLTAATTERSAALKARSEARSQLIALDEEREQQRPKQVFAASLPLPGAGGRLVRLRYRRRVGPAGRWSTSPGRTRPYGPSGPH